MPVPVDTALTSTEVQTAFQAVAIAALGGAEDFSTVRCGYQTQGQPAWKITDDVCIVMATEEEDEYNKLREVRLSQYDATHDLATTVYTRVWLLRFTFYGPNSFTRARRVKSAMYQQAAHDALAAKNLYMMMATDALTRAPENFQGEWWERTDWRAKFYEAVAEYELQQTVGSVEVLVYTDKPVPQPVRDITASGG